MIKKDALLRDVAKLLKKYRLADLSNAVSSLKKRSKRTNSRERSNPKRTKNAGVRKLKLQSKVKSGTRTKTRPSISRKSQKRSHAVEAQESLRARRPVATVRDIQKVSKKLGGKGQRDKRRDTTNYPVEQRKRDAYPPLARAPKVSVKDRGEDYAKWFRIISGDAGDTKPDDISAESTSAQGDESKWGKEAILHLRIRDFLLSGPFRLHSSSPSVSRTIIFLPNGCIGTGRSRFEADWRLSNGKLEILDEAGTVQSRFVLSSDGRFLAQTVDESEPLTRAQQLIRVASKK